ncbi:MAG: mannitol dehydrogenase family protein [Lachnospiraceae bacterium]|nr:mannitol dehydrogenase family protein [Lachnospiraceae bacterium]MBQ6995357.1 mannitol dehydrogenase family protein [Lachnospiraceae bacterium]
MGCGKLLRRVVLRHKEGLHVKLTNAGIIENRKEWEEAGYDLPNFDIEEVKKETHDNPEWIHFGAGNIFRAFQANVVQELLNAGKLKAGLIAAEGFDYEIIEKMYKPHDNLGILVTLKADGDVEKTVVGSIIEALTVDSDNEIDMGRLKEIFRNPSLKMVSFTITEKGYSLVDGKGVYLEAVQQDMELGTVKPISYIGKVVALLYERYKAGALPIAMVSMDNCSHNGDKLFMAVHAYAKAWSEKGLVEKEFLAYVEDKSKVSFPWSMIDKITPRPDASVEEILKNDGIEGLEHEITSKNTYVAPFVNAEECQYLVIEDTFPNGRPALEEGGIIFADREVVDKVEKMKVCTCLNPLHTTLAVFGCLLGYELISKEMGNPTLKRLVEIIGYEEGLPVVVDPGVIDPKKFIDEVVNERIPNPFMPDSPQRIATDTSQKLGIRFGETIKAYMKSDALDVKDIKRIPLVFAGWLRYLMGINDNGDKFELSSDPMLETVCPYVADLKLGDTEVHESVAPILANEKIFGVNLYEIGLGKLVEQYFVEMLAGKGAIMNTLKKYV